MRSRVLAGLLLVAAAPLVGQGYRLRIDNWAQAVSYRGVQQDSIPLADTLTGPTGGPVTSDGFAVTCPEGYAYCIFYRPGQEQRANPVSSTAALTAWGFGIPGLSIRAQARATTALGSSADWPGTEPWGQLVEGYAQYVRQGLTIDAGRQAVTSRLGYLGFDGGQLILRDARHGLDLSGYGGWGLWTGSVLPVTSPELNPLDEYRPPERTVVAGGSAGWTTSRFDVRATYQREVDPSVSYFVSERAGFDAALRPYRGLTLSGGGDYDMAQGLWGTVEASLRYVTPTERINAVVGVRRYRPHFDLWTIWGAFSPVPYDALDARIDGTVLKGVQLYVAGEAYRYDNPAVQAPLVQMDTSGWRYTWGARYTAPIRLTIEGNYHSEFGPGAASRGFDANLRYAWRQFLTVGLEASTLDRPLEFRYDDATAHVYGGFLYYDPSPGVHVELAAERYLEDRNRPDAAAFSWDQTRFSARVVLTFARGADLAGVPPAVAQMPTVQSQ